MLFLFFRKRTRELEAANAELMSALAYYADESIWRRRGVNQPGEQRQWVKPPVSRDRGARARTALESIEVRRASSARFWWPLPRLPRRSVPPFLMAADKRR